MNMNVMRAGIWQVHSLGCIHGSRLGKAPLGHCLGPSGPQGDAGAVKEEWADKGKQLCILGPSPLTEGGVEGWGAD